MSNRQIIDSATVNFDESKLHANWELLRRLAEQMPESSAKQAVSHAVERVEDQESAFSTPAAV